MDSYFFNANSRQAPQVVDKNVQPILDQSEVYSGCYGRISVNFYGFNNNGNRGIAAGLGITILAKLIIYILYGIEYMPSVSSLQISAWYTMFAMLGTARGIWIVCEDKAKYVKYYLGIGAVVNVILNYLMIPAYGPGGAAAATLITQIFTSILAPAMFKETRVYTKYVLEALVLKGIR